MSKPDATAGALRGKIECYEAIRGLAALAVVVGHLILGFAPALYFRNGARWLDIPAWLQVLARFPGKFLWNGELPVEIFFVLSGFVLSLGFYRSGSSAGVCSAAIRRFPRLLIPAGASIFLALILMQSGLMFVQQTVRHLDEIQGLTPAPGATTDASNNWLRGFYNFSPSPFDAVREGFGGAFFATARYNLVLWTMPIELAGSFLIYAFVGIFGQARNRWLLYGLGTGLLIALGHIHLTDFIAGMALCDWWTINQRAWRVQLSLLPALAILAIGIFVIPWKPISAFLVVATVALSTRLQELLSARWLSWLGRVSFAIYLIHMPIFCSLGCGLFLLLCREWGWSYGAGAFTASVTSLAATLVLAELFCRWVDRPAIVISRWIDVALFRAETPVTFTKPDTSAPVAKAA
ncbi:MAG: acyltransferase [Planctomycetes bacterium]|nr:acyltransferase [Planctomycetota bacterium]